jgi:hypothetical protein
VSTPLEREDRDRRDANSEERSSSVVSAASTARTSRASNSTSGPVARAFEARRLGYHGPASFVPCSPATPAHRAVRSPSPPRSRIHLCVHDRRASRCGNSRTILTTNEGNPLILPKVVTHSSGTQVANQDTAFTTSVSVIGNMRLDAYDFGDLIPVSGDILEDSGAERHRLRRPSTRSCARASHRHRLHHRFG